MPDPRQMHGQAIPAGELPAGSVTVRVVRESVGNNVAGVRGGAPRRRRRPAGDDRRRWPRAVCVGAAGARVHATAVVDGERLESTTFDVPAAGGVRTILVAGLGLGTGGGAQAAAPPAPRPRAAPAAGCRSATTRGLRSSSRTTPSPCSTCSRSSTSSGAPVTPASPLVITLPAEAVGAALLEGASPLAAVNGPRVSIAGPLPVGVTSVPIAFRVESWGARHEFTQAFPLPLDQVASACSG